MKSIVYNWRHMLRDYVRLMLDDKWFWCRHCRRPVEHAMVATEPPGQSFLTCMDCGFADPEFLRLNSERESRSDM
jgi:hypothetical protein